MIMANSRLSCLPCNDPAAPRCRNYLLAYQLNIRRAESALRMLSAELRRGSRYEPQASAIKAIYGYFPKKLFILLLTDFKP